PVVTYSLGAGAGAGGLSNDGPADEHRICSGFFGVADLDRHRSPAAGVVEWVRKPAGDQSAAGDIAIETAPDEPLFEGAVSSPGPSSADAGGFVARGSGDVNGVVLTRARDRKWGDEAHFGSGDHVSADL